MRGHRLRHVARLQAEAVMQRAGDRLLRLGRREHALKMSLKKSGSALRAAGIPFVVIGGAARWIYGAGMPTHDVDFWVKPEDAVRAFAVLEDIGMKRTPLSHPRLVQFRDGGILVDVLHDPLRRPLTDEILERAQERWVLGVPMLVVSLEDQFINSLINLAEHNLNYMKLLVPARALGTQVDWEFVRAQTSDSPFAKAFFTLVDELGISGARDGRPRAARDRPVPRSRSTT